MGGCAQRWDAAATAQELFADRPSYRRIELAVAAENEAGSQGVEAMHTEASLAVAAADAAEVDEEQGAAKRSLDDAKSSLGDAKRSLGDAESSLGDVKRSLGDAESSLGDAKSSLGDAPYVP